MFNLAYNKLFPGKNIHQCFQWIYFLLYHSGCLGFKLKNGVELYYNKWSIWYGYIIRTLLLTGFIGGFVVKIQDEESYQAMIGHLSPVVKFILCFECLVSTVTYLHVLFIMDRSRQKHLNFVNKLQKLDEHMLKDFPGIKWNYDKSARKYNPLTVLVYTFYAVVSYIYIFNLAKCSSGWLSSLIIALTYSSISGVPGFAGFLFVGNMDLLRIRFRLIQKLIRQYFTTQNTSQRKDIEDFRKFKSLEYYFKEYSYLFLPLNDVFGFVGAAGIFHDSIIITNLGFLLCSKALESKSKWYEYLFIILFMAPRVYKVLVTAIYGYLIQKEKRNCSHELVKMEYNFNKSLVVRDSVQSFLHWRMHNNYFITLGKVIHCCLSLIFLIFNGIANYILILIQLQFQQNNIVKRFSNRLNILEDVEIIKT